MLESYIGNLSKFLELTFLSSNDRSKWSRIKHFLGTATFFSIHIYSLVTFYMSGFQGLIDGLGFLNFIGTIVFCQQTFSYVKRNAVNEMLVMFETFQKEHKEPWEIEIFSTESKKGWIIIYYYCWAQVVYEFGYHLLPPIIDSILGYFFPELPSFSFPKVGQNIIDLTEPRSLNYMILTAISMMWSVVGVLAHIGGECFLLVPIVYMRAELKITRQRLVIMKEVLVKDGEDKQARVKSLLKEAVKNHQKALKGLNVMNEVLGYFMAVKLTVVSLCVCVNLFGMAFFGDVGPVAKIQAVYANVLLAFMLFYSCLFGETLESENVQLFHSIYDLPWFDKDSPDRKTLSLMMMLARKPFVVNFHQIAYLKLHTFMQVVNTSYSYFMMMKTTLSED